MSPVHSDLAVDLKGRTSLVTGANQGLGYSTAMELAKRGATVHMVCRNAERGQKARDDIVAATGNASVVLHVADLSSVAAVKKVAAAVNATGKPLHILVNNAGCLINPRTETFEGLEINFATNTVATFLLTEELLPLLRSSTPSRVITVSSGGQYTEELVTEDMQWSGGGFEGARQYARDKRRQTALTQWWAADAANAGVTFASMHPGWADTDAVRTSLPDFYNALKSRLRSPEQGADTIVWLCCAPAEKLQTGSFYFDRKATSVHLGMAGTQYEMAKVDELAKLLREVVSSVLASAKHEAVPASAPA